MQKLALKPQGGDGGRTAVLGAAQGGRQGPPAGRLPPEMTAERVEPGEERAQAQAAPREGAGGPGGDRDGNRGTSRGCSPEPTLPLPVVPRRRQVLPHLRVMFKKLQSSFHSQWRFLQPLSPGCVLGFLPPWYLHLPPGPLTLGG